MRYVLAVAVIAGVLAIGAASPSAARDTVYSCGTLPATSTHNTIWKISTRNISCRNGRPVVLAAFHRCARNGCRLSGGWTCNFIAIRYEQSTMRCTRSYRGQAVRFTTGV
jgi:hypothetical protein